MWFCRRKRGELESKKRGVEIPKEGRKGRKRGHVASQQPHIARQMEWERVVIMFLVKHCCDVIETQGNNKDDERVTP